MITIRRMIKTLVISGYCICSISGISAQHQQHDSLKEHFERKSHQYLQKDSTINGWYFISDKGISIYASPFDKKIHKPEFVLYWKELEAFKTYVKSNAPSNFASYNENKKGNASIEKASIRSESPAETQIPFETGKPLKGFRIALDPGHIAGNLEMAKIEKKFVEIKPSDKQSSLQNISLIEGNLTLATAKLLKLKLEAAGAEVLITRNAANISAFGITFEQWLSDDFHKALDIALKQQKITAKEKHYLATKASKREIFLSFFNSLDIRERARKINEFKPDLTLIIHYNVDEKNNDWSRTTVKNFNMAFVGGSFMGEELNEIENRFEFLRLLISEDIENSISLSEQVMKRFEKRLKVQAANENDASYLNEFSLKTNIKGVYARNLSLTRLVHGTLVYGESLYQDNIEECFLLSQKEFTIDNLSYSKRELQVAEAYYEGILNYMYKIR